MHLAPHGLLPFHTYILAYHFHFPNLCSDETRIRTRCIGTQRVQQPRIHRYTGAHENREIGRPVVQVRRRVVQNKGHFGNWIEGEEEKTGSNMISGGENPKHARVIQVIARLQSEMNGVTGEASEEGPVFAVGEGRVSGRVDGREGNDGKEGRGKDSSYCLPRNDEKKTCCFTFSLLISLSLSLISDGLLDLSQTCRTHWKYQNRLDSL